MRKAYNTQAKNYIESYFIRNAEMAVSADDIQRSMCADGVNVNITTVYRCLDRMAAEGMLAAFRDGNRTLFRAVNADECHSHLHVRCDRCGKILHLDCDFMDSAVEHIKGRHGFVISCDHSILSGVCGECLQKQKDKND